METKIRFAGIDFESARLRSGRGDVPVQIGIAEMAVDGALDPESAWSSFLAPPEPVLAGKGLPELSVLESAPPMLSLWPRIRDSLRGRILIAHGAGTEKRFLRSFPGHGFGPWIDTLRLARAAFPGLRSHALGEICSQLGLEQEIDQTGVRGTWHEALFDAVACLILLRKILIETNLDPHSDFTTLQTPNLETYIANRRNPQPDT